MNPENVIDLLQSRSIITEEQGEELLVASQNSGRDIFDVVEDFQLVDRDALYQSIAEEIGADYLDLKEFAPDEAILALIPATSARLYGALPIGLLDDGSVQVAFSDPLNPQNMEDLRFAIEKDIV
ncbi:MAG: pilus assembly protein PilB, partial [Verrucomicrobiota bacterium]